MHEFPVTSITDFTVFHHRHEEQVLQAPVLEHVLHETRHAQATRH